MISHKDITVQVSTGLDDAAIGAYDDGEWDVSLWGSSELAWQNISPYVTNISIRRGTPRFDSRFKAGTCSLKLLNEQGIFSPVSGQGIWSLPFRPGRFIRVFCTATEPVTPLYFGVIDSIEDSYSRGGYQIRTSVQCVDGLGILSGINLPALESPRGVERTDERLLAVLARASISPDNVLIQTGEHNMQGDAQIAQSLLEEAARCAEAEGGAFWATAQEGEDGGPEFVFRARDWLTTDTRSTELQAAFGYEDTVPSTPIVGEPVTLYDRNDITNFVQYARTGGTAQVVFDDPSIFLYQLRSDTRLDLKCNTDADVLYLAERKLATHKDLKYRVESVTIDNVTGLDELHYSLDFGDLVGVQLRTSYGWNTPNDGPTLAHIVGISHDINKDYWTTTYQVDQSVAEA